MRLADSGVITAVPEIRFLVPLHHNSGSRNKRGSIRAYAWKSDQDSLNIPLNAPDISERFVRKDLCSLFNLDICWFFYCIILPLLKFVVEIGTSFLKMGNFIRQLLITNLGI